MLLHGDVGRLERIEEVTSGDDIVIFVNGVLYRIDFDIFADFIALVENLPYRQTSSETTLNSSDSVLECTANTFDVMLPTAIGIKGRVFSVDNSGGGIITLKAVLGQTINDLSEVSVSDGSVVTVISNGSVWRIR